MKNLLLSFLVALIGAFGFNGHAQSITDPYIFNHLGVSAHAATTGFGFELATPVTRFVTLRAGASFMPGFSFNTDVDGTYQSEYGTHDFTMNVKGGLKRAQGSVILNVYPLANISSFYIAAGGYFGGSRLVDITGHSDQLQELAGNPSIEIGDYQIPVDKNGNVNGQLKANSFRPYLGLGFGRPLPKGRLNFGVELGVQFMGKMKLYTDGEELTKVLTDNDDDWQKWMDKLTVYPVLKFTLSGRIF